MKKIFYLLIFKMLLLNMFADNLTFVRTVVPSQPMETWKFDVKKDRFYIMSSENCIYCLTLAGKVINKIGRQGEGPGEFKSLADFFIRDNQIIAADYERKINVFSLDGILVDEKKTKNTIDNILSSGKSILYVSKRPDTRDKKNIKFYLKIFDAGNGGELYSIPDESKVNAIHPSSGQKFVFPWYPAPFYNRANYVTGRDEKLRLFFTRENFFYVFEDGEFKKVDFKFKLKSKEVTAIDRQNFLDQVDRGSGRKFPGKTKKSVIFPDTKELFSGAINWDNEFALVCETHLVIISKNGDFIKRISFPSSKKAYDRALGYPENIMVKQGDSLYIKNEEEEISVFKIH